MSEPTAIPNELLKYERDVQRNWSQSTLAEYIDLKSQGDIDRVRTIRRWESGEVEHPQGYYLKKLVKVFERTAAQLGYPQPGKISHWHVPHARNSYFTGREDILEQLQTNLTQSELSATFLPQILIGRKGIGKTQIALEYAYRNIHKYHTIVWLQAHSSEILAADFASIATLLELPISKDVKDENKLIRATKDWLEHPYITRWLLIFDNVEDPEDLQNIAQYISLPCHGHIIITTQLHTCSIEAQKIEIEKMNHDEGARLFLKRANFLVQTPSSSLDHAKNYQQAVDISNMLDTYPPALDAAGAYIEETKSSLTSFVETYQSWTQQKISSTGKVEPDTEATTLAMSTSYPQWLIQHNAYLTHESTRKPTPSTELKEPVMNEYKEVEQRYLDRVIQDTYLSGLVGIPGLISQRVPLDQIFIPLQFHPNRPRVDYPLSDAEIKEYRASQKRGMFDEDLERMLFEAEKNWVHTPTDDTISIAELWQSLIPQVPAVVIQGYPGMGKSTLLARMALYMARSGLSQGDTTMDITLTSAHIPILLSLGKYARQRMLSPSLTLLDYLKSTLKELSIPDLEDYIDTGLKTGHCLVMLDGLDEASIDEAGMREQVQEEIKRLIHDSSRNRFLITSRVAGYDQSAFPDYTHFLIAPLTLRQIEDFLPRWCRANVLKSRGMMQTTSSEQEASVINEAVQMEKGLGEAIRNYPAVRHLAENPLLLTLLSVMHQNSIQLPQRRIDLYDVVTRTLLEHRNQTNNLPWIPEAQAIAYLGPLAYQMQKTANSLARQDEVTAKLKEAISHQGGSDEQVTQEVKKFLARLRERGGIFVLRAGDFFGFFHRTFQEYFVARYILNKIYHDPDREIMQLVEQVQRSDDLWREPFLLAVAYATGENQVIARKIIITLLDAAQKMDFDSQIHALLLANECLIEAKPFTTGTDLQRRVAQSLLQFYAQAQQLQRFDVCSQIEDVLQRRLSIIQQFTYQSGLLITLEQTMSNREDQALVQATLTLLSLIGQELDECTPIVFNTLIPLLLALAGLPAVSEHKPTTGLATASDLSIRDLALTALCFMGKSGPTGLLLKEVRQYFERYPEHLRLLARYSLESNTLLTFTVIPLTEENYQRYEGAIEQWIKLRDRHQTTSITKVDIEECLSIHQKLLDCAEEVCYPGSIHLMNMLQSSANRPEQPWQQIWQKYLLDQMVTGDYINYQEAILLWITLFPEPEMQDVIAFQVLADYERGELPAQHFIALLSNDLTEPKELRDQRELRYLRYLRDVNYVTYSKFIKYMPHIRQLKHLRYLKYLKSLKYMKYLSLMRYQRYLRYRLFTEKVAGTALERLLSATITEEKDLLAILFGRVRQIQESRSINDKHKRELLAIENVVNTKRTSAYADEVREVIQEILNYSPLTL